jgi:DMSO/TMAO reductase YedYZ molybdopterin-dependent catalytic subunit
MAPLPPGEPWGTGAVSTASWTGPPLALLLERAGVRDDAVEILVSGADRGTPAGAREAMRFARALPLDKAMDPNVILAVEMNGRPLPIEHGAPARLVVPGWYGMASVKWVARIAALTEPFEGWFQRDRYVYERDHERRPVDVMRVKSTIVTPESGRGVARGRVLVWGWAWSGAAQIAAVELSLDGGEWQEATLDPQLAPHAWRRFAHVLDVGEPGRHSPTWPRGTSTATATTPSCPCPSTWFDESRVGDALDQAGHVLVALAPPAHLVHGAQHDEEAVAALFVALAQVEAGAAIAQPDGDAIAGHRHLDGERAVEAGVAVADGLIEGLAERRHQRVLDVARQAVCAADADDETERARSLGQEARHHQAQARRDGGSRRFRTSHHGHLAAWSREICQPVKPPSSAASAAAMRRRQKRERARYDNGGRRNGGTDVAVGRGGTSRPVTS